MRRPPDGPLPTVARAKRKACSSLRNATKVPKIDTTYRPMEDENVPQCLSPIGEPELLGDVFCLSSAGDSQTTWGKGNVTMTRTLLALLKKSIVKPTIGEVMKSLLDTLGDLRLEAVLRGLADKESRQQPQLSQSCMVRISQHVKKMQLPQFGSLSPWARNKRLSF